MTCNLCLVTFKLCLVTCNFVVESAKETYLWNRFGHGKENVTFAFFSLKLESRFSVFFNSSDDGRKERRNTWFDFNSTSRTKTKMFSFFLYSQFTTFYQETIKPFFPFLADEDFFWKTLLTRNWNLSRSQFYTFCVDTIIKLY